MQDDIARLGSAVLYLADQVGVMLQLLTEKFGVTSEEINAAHIEYQKAKELARKEVEDAQNKPNG